MGPFGETFYLFPGAFRPPQQEEAYYRYNSFSNKLVPLTTSNARRDSELCDDRTYLTRGHSLPMFQSTRPAPMVPVVVPVAQSVKSVECIELKPRR